MLTPELPYETTGFVDNVCFPVAALTDQATGRIAIYYGCADTCVSMAFTTVDAVVDYVKAHSSV
jgi:beta-1,4-mannooligosaccharide/beta-1,4-mannosyl-N-acetylglucosamine phosphorylase